MNYQKVAQNSRKTGMAGSTPQAAEQERSRERREWGRKAVLNGWVIAMIGIVIYCYIMLAGEQSHVHASLFARGLPGWIALSFMIGGVGLWFTGSLVHLGETEHSTAETESGDDD